MAGFERHVFVCTNQRPCDSPRGCCDPEGKRAYVSNPKDDSVSVIDIEAAREVTRIKVGKGPKRVAFSVE